jgi:hypothetical protein
VWWELVRPGKEAEVVAGFDDLVLQPSKCLPAFPIEKRHVNIEDTQKTVCHILHTSCSAPGGPAHPPSHGNFFQRVVRVSKNAFAYPRESRKHFVGPVFIPPEIPGAVKEVDRVGCDEFLESPASSEPLAIVQRTVDALTRIPVRYISVANIGIPIPVKHGVDRLGELG